jgi:hypothetical protein
MIDIGLIFSRQNSKIVGSNPHTKKGEFMFYKVYLKDGTTGAIVTEKSADNLIGTNVTVRARDENGNPIQLQGMVEEVLEEYEFDYSFD